MSGINFTFTNRSVETGGRCLAIKWGKSQEGGYLVESDDEDETCPNGFEINAWRQVDGDDLWCSTNLTCLLECEQIKGGIYRENEVQCLVFEVLKRLCLTVEAVDDRLEFH